MELVSWLVVIGILVLEAVIVTQGVILVIILFQKRNQNSLVLGWFILCLSLNQLIEIVTGYGLFLVPVPSGYFFTLCYGPLFYFYLKTYFSTEEIQWKKTLVHFIPALISLLIILVDYRILYTHERTISIIVMVLFGNLFNILF